MFTLPVISLALLCIAGSVAVVFGFGAIRYHEYLYKVEHGPTRPKTIAKITIYLVKSLLDINPTPLKFYMYHWQSINQYRYVVAVLIRTTLLFVLVNHLQAVIVNVGFIYQLYVLCQSVVKCQVQDIAFTLYHLGLILNSHLFVRNHR